MLSTRSVSPLKKIKRKAGYGDDTNTAQTTHAMKKLHIDDETQGRDLEEVDSADTVGTLKSAVGV